MAHRLNTNKQFMIGNGILAFAVIFVVVIFVYMSMRLQQRKEGERNFIETYTITLTKGFAGDSTSIFINDSLLVNRTIAEEPFTIEVKRFAEQNALMIVNNATEKLSLFELSEKGGEYNSCSDTAAILHTFCSVTAKQLQCHCKGIAAALQKECSDSARGMQ